LTQKINIIIVDDHPITLKGFASVFDDYEDLEIIAVAKDGLCALELLKTHKPDIIILDIEIPLLDGVETMKKIHVSFPEVKVVLISFHSEDAFILDCISQGASAYLTKGSALNVIVETIYRVYKDGYCFSKRVVDGLLKKPKKGEKMGAKELSERELEIVKLVCEGLMNKEIAASLKISISTVDFYKKNIHAKTGTKSTAELVLYAIANDIVTVKKVS
jgi:DNA-binding NarL/FixJ family response regulator